MKFRAISILVLSLLLIAFAGPAQAQTFHTLYSFAGGSDGASPSGWITSDGSGNFLGVTGDGGADCPKLYETGCGTIFQLTQSGSESVLHRFNGGPAGRFPEVGLTPAGDGEYYGSTGEGSSPYSGGAVYRFNPTTGTIVNVHAFSGDANGGGPFGVIVGLNGDLYGVTIGGGNLTNPSCQYGGCGVVFQMTTKGRETVLHTFTGSPDGYEPKGSLVQDSEGNLYGTTNGGGAGTCNCGTVYKIDPQGNETILHSFSGTPDAALPTNGLLLDSQGNLYGVTWAGGAHNEGTIFQLDPAGNLTILYSFKGTHGANPSSSLISDSVGNLYGFTYSGGNLSCGFEGSGCGTVFEFESSGTLKTLHRFTETGSDGGGPDGGHLVFDAAGNLYGVTSFGGTYADGTIFEITF